MTARRRKYTTEFRLLVTVHIDWICRPQELDQLAAIDFERPPHLYFITSHPRMTVDDNDITVDDVAISGRIRRQIGPDYDHFDFRMPHPFGPDVVFSAPWPHETFKLHNANGDEVGDGVVANLGIASIPEKSLKALDFEVLYVGQAYGSAGERLAPERLKSHPTLQRILAECPPDKQIWLMVASISDEVYLIEMDPRVTPTTTDDEDRDHIKLVTNTIDDPAFREYDAVNIAEAGLIRFFQPIYNNVFKNTFPNYGYKMLESLRQLDLLGLIVEVQGWDIPVSLRSQEVSTAMLHFAEYDVHLDGPSRASDWAYMETLTPKD